MSGTERRQPDWDLDLRNGQEAEQQVLATLLGVAAGTVEVKRDDGAERYGNVFIETRCLQQGVWRWSGIATTKADLWAQVLPGGVMVIVPVPLLRDVVRAEFALGNRRVNRQGSHPTEGVVISLSALLSRIHQSRAA